MKDFLTMGEDYKTTKEEKIWITLLVAVVIASTLLMK